MAFDKFSQLFLTCLEENDALRLLLYTLFTSDMLDVQSQISVKKCNVIFSMSKSLHQGELSSNIDSNPNVSTNCVFELLTKSRRQAFKTGDMIDFRNHLKNSSKPYKRQYFANFSLIFVTKYQKSQLLLSCSCELSSQAGIFLSAVDLYSIFFICCIICSIVVILFLWESLQKIVPCHISFSRSFNIPTYYFSPIFAKECKQF